MIKGIDIILSLELQEIVSFYISEDKNSIRVETCGRTDDYINGANLSKNQISELIEKLKTLKDQLND